MDKIDKLLEKIYADIKGSQEKIFMAFITLNSEKMWEVAVHYFGKSKRQRIEKIGVFLTEDEALEALHEVKRNIPLAKDYNCFVFNLGESDG